MHSVIGSIVEKEDDFFFLYKVLPFGVFSTWISVIFQFMHVIVIILLCI